MDYEYIHREIMPLPYRPKIDSEKPAHIAEAEFFAAESVLSFWIKKLKYNVVEPWQHENKTCLECFPVKK